MRGRKRWQTTALAHSDVVHDAAPPVFRAERIVVHQQEKGDMPDTCPHVPTSIRFGGAQRAGHGLASMSNPTPSIDEYGLFIAISELGRRNAAVPPKHRSGQKQLLALGLRLPVHCRRLASGHRHHRRNAHHYALAAGHRSGDGRPPGIADDHLAILGQPCQGGTPTPATVPTGSALPSWRT